MTISLPFLSNTEMTPTFNRLAIHIFPFHVEKFANLFYMFSSIPLPHYSSCFFICNGGVIFFPNAYSCISLKSSSKKLMQYHKCNKTVNYVTRDKDALAIRQSKITHPYEPHLHVSPDANDSPLLARCVRHSQ